MLTKCESGVDHRKYFCTNQVVGQTTLFLLVHTTECLVNAANMPADVDIEQVHLSLGVNAKNRLKN